MRSLKIAILSLDIKAGDKKANLTALENAVANLDRTIDLLLLPELFSTGFISDKSVMAKLAESNGGDTVALLHALADKYNFAFAGSFLASTVDKLYNRAFFIEPMGDEAFYDKRHLFSIGSEPQIVTAGHDTKALVRFRGWNIALVICYDLRFPVACRNAGNEYDLLVVPANWPRSRQYAWTHLLKARAIENQSYVIGVNRSGADSNCQYDDMSEAIDFKGKTMQLSGDGSIGYVTIDKDSLEKWRDDFPVWKDSDLFSIH